MDWQNYIHSGPKVLVGKPVIKGTRLSVEFILGLFSESWTTADILDSYPSLIQDSLKAVFAFSAQCMKDELTYTIAPVAEAV